jgi:hypothetical protein
MTIDAPNLIDLAMSPCVLSITKIKTGFGTGGWQLAALNICSKAARKPLIADGRAALLHMFNAANCQPPVPKPVLIFVIQTLPGPIPTFW